MHHRWAFSWLACGVIASSIAVACGDDSTPEPAGDAGDAGEAGEADATTTEAAAPVVDAAIDSAPQDARSDGSDANLCVPPSGDAAIVDFIVPTFDGGAAPLRIARGPDGNMWFTDDNAPYLARTNETGTMTIVPLPGAGSRTGGITVGTDGALWFTEIDGKLGRVDPLDGGITEFPLPPSDAGPTVPVELVSGPDGNLWMSVFDHSVARMTPAGVVTQFDVGPDAGDAGPLWPSVLAVGPDGNVWFASAQLPLISRITTAGVVTHFPVSGRSFGVAVGPDNAVWFTMQGKLGRITFEPAPTITEFDVPGALLGEIVRGPDCTSLYVADSAGNRVRRFAPPASDAGADAALTFIDYAVPTPSADVESLATSPDGRVWFVEVAAARVGFIRP
jgi:virginiamycin B lyase